MQQNIEQQIRSNIFRSYLWMVILTTGIAALGALLSYFFSWGLTGTSSFIVVAGVINFFAYFFSDKIILRATGAKPLPETKAPELYIMIRKLISENELPMPAVYLVEDRTMNAFATGRDQVHSAIAVSRGLLERMTPEEIEGVLAHELSHIKNYDMRLSAIIAVLVGFISLLADMYWSSQVASRIGEKDRSGVLAIIGVVIAVIAPLSAMFIQLAISRKRELLADACGAQLSKHPHALASALNKIAHDVRLPAHYSSATAHLYFSMPTKSTGLIERLFSTHPPIEERIALLKSLSINS
jgi:heat shock protein HtpX